MEKNKNWKLQPKEREKKRVTIRAVSVSTVWRLSCAARVEAIVWIPTGELVLYITKTHFKRCIIQLQPKVVDGWIKEKRKRKALFTFENARRMRISFLPCGFDKVEHERTGGSWKFNERALKKSSTKRSQWLCTVRPTSYWRIFPFIPLQSWSTLLCVGQITSWKGDTCNPHPPPIVVSYNDEWCEVQRTRLIALAVSDPCFNPFSKLWARLKTRKFTHFESRD